MCQGKDNAFNFRLLAVCFRHHTIYLEMLWTWIILFIFHFFPLLVDVEKPIDQEKTSIYVTQAYAEMIAFCISDKRLRLSE